MNFEAFFNKLLSFYKVKTVTDLANKLDVTRSTVAGWKSRQATGTILEYLFHHDLKALHFIFENKNINNFQNSINAVAQDFSNNSNAQQIQNNETYKLFNIAHEMAKEKNNIEDPKDKPTNNLSKYFIALQSVAVATNKEYELEKDIRDLMKKYIVD